MNIKPLLLALSLTILACKMSAPPELSPNTVVPTVTLIEYQEMELIGFIHFTVNTFTDKEWGYGDESPEIFNPSDLLWHI